MVFITVSAVLALAASATSVLGSPWPSTFKHTTHHVRDLDHGVQVRSFQPESKYETFGDGVDGPHSRRDTLPSGKEVALDFITSRSRLNSSSLVYKSGFVGEVAEHVYVRQTFYGIEASNAVSNVALVGGKVVAYGNSFVEPASVGSPTPKLTPQEAISKAEAKLNAKYNGSPVKTEYFVPEDRHVVLTYVVEVANPSHWFVANVDAQTGDVVNVADYGAHASYRVNPLRHESPLEGFTTLRDPNDPIASPRGWHFDGTTRFTVTQGNNVFAFTTDGAVSQSSPKNNYIYRWDGTLAPTTPSNRNASVVNGFYIGNTIHDLTYRYGFTEKAFNFQTNNFGKGGLGGDAVRLFIQDPSGVNNANFFTPADGSSPLCRMFLWNRANPQRDGALENDIPVHEFTHGTTNRLTGGGTGTCLQTIEAGGLGEGWSDTFAFVTEQKSAKPVDFVVGPYVFNNPGGLRSRPYSISKAVNPYTYARLQLLSEVHDIGEVWANILVNVYHPLVRKYGFSRNLFNPRQKEGNIVFLHLFMDALSLQPCNPTFLNARDAIIQADVNRYRGRNKCLLWKAFASRGLGVRAANHIDDSTLPRGCH